MFRDLRTRTALPLKLMGLGALALSLASGVTRAHEIEHEPLIDIAEDNPELASRLASARAAYETGDFVTARRLMQELAEAGRAASQVDLALMMFQGKGGPVDRESAEDWLRKAAAQSHPVAFRVLGQLEQAYTRGLPKGENDPVRENWDHAVELGDVPAHYLLGQYLLEHVAESEATRALDLIEHAAENGHVEAQYRLSELLSQGRVTEPDPTAAVGWLIQAAEAGMAQAQYELARNFESGAVSSTSGDAAAAAIDWYRRAAEGGHTLAQRTMGARYLSGEGVEQNAAEAVRWFEAAAAAGDSGALFNLGMMFSQGLGVEKDAPRALRYLAGASERGVAQASYEAGRLLDEGDGVPQNVDQSFEFYIRAETQGSSEARRRLGQLAAANFLGGRVAPHDAVPWVLHSANAGDAESLTWLTAKGEDGLRQAMHALGLYHAAVTDGGSEARNAKEAVAWYTKAAQADFPPAQLELGRMISRGEGTESDFVAAHKWFNIAAARGISEAAPLRDALTDLMTAEQVAEAQAAASAFFEEIRNAPPPIPASDGGDGR